MLHTAMMTMRSQLDREKLKAAILRVVSRCKPEELGAVKLHKALYYSDMIEFAATGRPITGAEYRKRPFGPTCDAALAAVRDLERQGALRAVDVPYYGYSKREFHLLVQPSFDNLSDSELELLDDMTAFVCRDHTARAISEISHDISWHMVEMGEVIPYHLAFNLVPSIVTDESIEWAEGAYGEIEGARSQQDPLEFEVFSTLRNRLSEARR